MIFSDASALGRADAKQLQAILRAAPKQPWMMPKGPLEGVVFHVTSRFDLRHAQGAVARTLAGAGDLAHAAFERLTAVEAAGPFVRIGSVDGAACGGPGEWALSHPEFGAVLVDPAARSFVHLGPEHLPQPLMPASLKSDLGDWSLDSAEGRTVLRLPGRYGLEVHVAARADKGPDAEAVAATILRAVLPGLDGLTALGLPFAALCRVGLPEVIEVICPGSGTKPVAVHRIERLERRSLEPARFSVPEGFRDLRNRSGKSKGRDAPRGSVIAQRPLGSGGAQGVARQARARNMSAVAALPDMWKIVPSPVPILPSCGPVVFGESGAIAVRQSLLDAVTEAGNLLARRFGSFDATGVTVDGVAQLRFAVDWLSQIEAQPATDGVRIATQVAVSEIAHSLARQFCAANPPVPLGGTDDPIALLPVIEARLLALAADPAVDRDDRFDRLPGVDRDFIVNAVTTARLAVFPLDLPSESVNSPFPSEDFQLVDVRAMLEAGRLTIGGQNLVNTLAVNSFAPDGPPGIDLSISVSRLELTLGMTRSPGAHFWITAAGVLVVGGLVAAAAAAAVILTLIGMGPFGLMLLGMGLTSLGTIALAAVAGGALLLGAVLYLVWDETTMGVDIADLTVTSRLRFGARPDGSAAVLVPSSTTAAGTISISLESEIPSGMHQFFDVIAEAIIAFCDTEVRRAFRRIVSDELAKALAKVPLLRSPLSGRRNVAVAALLNGETISDGTPDGILTETVAGIETKLEGGSINGRDGLSLTAGVQAGMEFPFAVLRPFVTQVAADAAPALDRRVATTEAGDRERRGVLLGHAVSQNMINGVAHARWLTGWFKRDLSERDTTQAFAALGAADVRLAGFAAGGQRVHVFAAASPSILVSPRAFADDPSRPCLLASFNDIRVCFEAVLNKVPSAVEFRLAAETVAHLVLGGTSAAGTAGFSLLAVGGAMLHLRYDPDDTVNLHPPGAQSVVGQGGAEDLVAGLDRAAMAALMAAMQPTLALAARALIGRDGLEHVVFDTPDGARNVQIADGAFLIETTPEAEALYITLRLLPAIADRLPFTDATGTFQSPRFQL